jgi:hypothetical protein
MKWIFSPKSPGERTRDPVSSEFFAADAIRNAGEALVREGIQNSLDARLDRERGKARVRIYVSGPTNALPPAAHERWFGSAWPHYQAKGNGLQPGAISPDSPCHYLVFEDFETTGLLGDPLQYELKPEVRNLFFYFFRAEGATEKDANKLGRWGIGKQVFPRSSLAQTLFGYSEVRENGSNHRFMMGSCVLKHHSVDGVVYRPDGYFGEAIEVRAGEELPVPLENPEILEHFKTDFNICRQDGETGLSVVVPWLDSGNGDGVEKFDVTSLTLAVIEGYFAPILEGRLEVTIEDDERSIHINAENFLEVCNTLESNTADADLSAIKHLRASIKLAAASKEGGAVVFEIGACPEIKPAWTEDMLSQDLSGKIRSALMQDVPIEVRARLTVRHKAADAETAVFSCHVMKADGVHARPFHIREDLIISGVKCRKLNGYVAIIRIPSGPLANLLGDSENPAHTEWNASSQHFKDKYIYGGVTIEFVSQFATELLRRVFASSRELDRGLLMSYFHDPGPESQSPKPPRPPKGSTAPGEDDPALVPEIQLRLPQIRIARIKDEGFKVMNGTDVPLATGTLIDIRAAYETTKGNPFKSYKPYDFAFQGRQLLIACQEAEALDVQDNLLVIRVAGPEFEVSVTGFDRNRDLIVKAIRRKSDTEVIADVD